MTPKRFISTKPFQMPAMVQPSPTATEIQSGMRAASCSAASRPEVFLPSMRTGLIAQLRLYQPKVLAASWQR